MPDTTLLLNGEDSVKYLKIFELFKENNIDLKFDDNNKKLTLDKYTIYFTNKLAVLQTLEEIFINRAYYFFYNKKNPFIIDAGSEVGIATLFFKIFYPQAKILCFEPHPLAFKLLTRNIAINNFEHVTAINAALTKEDGTCDFFGELDCTNPDSRGSSIFDAWGLQRETCNKTVVKTTRLSKYINRRVDYLKLNVEGAEQQVLQELKDKIKLIDKLLIKFYHSKKLHDVNNLSTIYQLLPNMGFAIKTRAKKICGCIFPDITQKWISENDTQLFTLYAENTKKTANKHSHIENELAKKIFSLKTSQLERELFLLRNIIDNIPASIYWKDEAGYYLGHSAYAASQLRETNIEPNATPENIIGKSDYDIFPKKIADKYRTNDTYVMKNKKEFVLEETIVMPNGKELVQLSSKKPLFDINRQVIGIIGSTIDITDRKKIEELQIQKHKEQAEKIREITAQVAHDIRSPLTSLKVLAGQLQNVDEETRILLRNATNRINDTINNLTIKYGAGGEIATFTAVTPELISSLVDNLLSEKRAQYFDQNINFELNVSDDAQGLFARINAEKFKRILSNLVNNAVEAINCAKQKRGYISLVIIREHDLIQLQVKDNGSGMSQELITKIGTTKITTKTEGNHGIGLSSAIPLLKEWGGDYSIESELNQGTTFTIKLPVATSPVWFQDKIYLAPNSDVIILDDDASIHNIWEARFKQFKGKVSLKHFTNSAGLLEQLTELQANPNNLFLIDYELLGSKNTGLDVIKKLELNHNAFLVTSRYEDETVKTECAKLNIKMVPKNFAPYIPLLLIAKENANLDTATADFVQPQYILIDDDFSLIKSWQMEAKMHGASLATFSRVADFEKVKSKFDKAIPIYIDYQLGTHNGLEYSKQLADEGFSNIYLATGHDKSSITEPAPWLKDIVGKEPPFANLTRSDNSRITASLDPTGKPRRPPDGSSIRPRDNNYITQLTEAPSSTTASFPPSSTDDIVEKELWRIWRAFYHNLMQGPVTLKLGLTNIGKYLPELIATYRKEHANATDAIGSKINTTALHYLENSANMLKDVVETQIWELQVKRMQLATLDAVSYPLSAYSMADCLAESINKFPAAKLHNLDQPLKIPDITNFTFLGNAEIMQHIIFNLLDQSLYGMRSAGKNTPDELSIFTSKDDNYNYLHIKNRGIAITAEDLPKLFNKFFTTPMDRDSSGLGLYFCRKAMHYFGGDISCIAAQNSNTVKFVLKFRKV